MLYTIKENYHEYLYLTHTYTYTHITHLKVYEVTISRAIREIVIEIDK